MRRSSVIFGTGALVLLAMLLALPVAGMAADAPRMSAEVLKALIDNPQVIVLDVRRGSDYAGSTTKVKGAIRESEKDISWAGKYGMEKVIVLYCA